MPAYPARGRQAVTARAVQPAAVRRPLPSLREPVIGAGAIFALKLAVGILAGVLVAIACWHVAAWLTAAPAERYETAERAGGSFGADPVDAPSDAVAFYPRQVKTVAFMAPSRALVAPARRPPLIRNWRYQLQNISPAAIAASPHDFVVIDHGGENGPFSRAEVERMKRKPDGGRRFVVAYMSIGEAESYRWYWAQRQASWLGAENAKWRGNYAVRFWDPAWQQIILDYTDRILAAGFDGVYLDKVDEFETMGHRDDMVEFVARIAAHAKRQRPDFMIVSQNGDALIPDAKFRRAIDAFAREDLLYGEDRDGVRNDAATIRASIKRLKALSAEGKPVLVVEYPRSDEQAQAARNELAEQGFIGLTAKRALNAL